MDDVLTLLRAAGARGDQPRQLTLTSRREDLGLAGAGSYSSVRVRRFEPGTEPPPLAHPDWLREHFPPNAFSLDAVREATRLDYRAQVNAQATAAKRRRDAAAVEPEAA